MSRYMVAFTNERGNVLDIVCLDSEDELRTWLLGEVDGLQPTVYGREVKVKEIIEAVNEQDPGDIYAWFLKPGGQLAIKREG